MSSSRPTRHASSKPTQQSSTELLLRDRLRELGAAVDRGGQDRLVRWRPLIQRSSFEPSAANLASYLALRAHDLRPLQTALSEHGLSSLGRCEAHVLNSLSAVTEAVSRIAGHAQRAFPVAGWKARTAQHLAEQTADIFGRDPAGPRSRIMVTIGADQAHARQVGDLIAAGADCIRINCAHDDQRVWTDIIAQTRNAATTLKRDCRVLMDIAGPKVRIADVEGPGKNRVHAGDELLLVGSADHLPTKPRTVAVAITHAAIVKQLKAGHRISIDDGKLQGVVTARTRQGVVLRAERVRARGVKLRPGKGINFPSLALQLPPLTEKDLQDLDFIARHADIVGYSFVQRPVDIQLLQGELERRLNGRALPPLMIKVETRLGVANLPDLIVTAAGRQPTAVMIARGDLAVELGLLELSEIQEQLLWVCEAAHVPVVWATQVLDGLLKSGIPTRAETTDAAMAQRAECVMLNKGPHALEAVQFLDQVLRRMDEHVLKKSPHLNALPFWVVSRGHATRKYPRSRATRHL